MKFSLIATIVVLALAQGSLAQQEYMDLEKIGQYVEAMKTKITQDLTEIIATHDLANQASTFLEAKKTEMEPLFNQFQEQIKSATANMETHAASMQTQIQPMMEKFQQQMEILVKDLTDKAKAIGN